LRSFFPMPSFLARCSICVMVSLRNQRFNVPPVSKDSSTSNQRVDKYEYMCVAPLYSRSEPPYSPPQSRTKPLSRVELGASLTAAAIACANFGSISWWLSSSLGPCWRAISLSDHRSCCQSSLGPIGLLSK
jgi:hypothetical protein